MENWDLIINARLHALGWQSEAFVRLVLAVVAGGLIGLEREVRGRQAGFRTNLLVCLGSALVMIVSTRVAFVNWPSNQASGIDVRVDPARIAYGVMGGIGFLGAGTIVQHRGSVRGLTTAAGLWCVAALGLASGLGLYVLTFYATLLVLAALWVLDYFGGMLPKTYYRNVVVRTSWGKECVGRTVAHLKTTGLKVVDVSFQRTENLKDVDIELRVAFPSKKVLYQTERKLEDDRLYELLSIREI